MVQADKINQLAEVVFKEEDQITISGQGMLRRMFLSAYLSEGGQQILPPREHYYFNRNSHASIDMALVSKVATYFILSEKEAIMQVRFWEKMLLTEVKKDHWRFGKYGVFQFDNQLNFVSDSLYIYDWLPPVSYKSTGIPVREILSHNPVEKTPALNGQQKIKRKILIPVLWSVLISFFAFAAFLWSEPLNLLFVKSAEMNSRLVNVAPESYSAHNESDYFSDTHEMMSTDADMEEKSGDENKDNLVISEENKVVEPAREDLSLKEDAAAISSLKAEENAGVIMDVPEEANPRCTLIVGAFANPDNVDRMVSRLGHYDVKVITVERRTLTLVGAQVRCGDDAQINGLKNQIEPNAWIYKK